MTHEQLALSEAIAIAGSQTELARKLTVSCGRLVKQQHVWNWLKRQKRPPANITVFIEKCTGVSRERLRPDIFADPLNAQPPAVQNGDA
ncbi:TPA: helix-turn-helix domain-containing protein [Escherichia coli]|nr:helix-turn-helix domain-containing protein [Escherichia coli]HEL8385893.1 helix-turn-helix domain-containing protein [Escherichia coli]HEM0058735.1 helix-turn-helix domain-containing protein [Escherichia coli]HEM0087196.1 helix-turn-helix domain-containing protein [Escherichia coli]